jgi:hypothetical protein
METKIVKVTEELGEWSTATKANTEFMDWWKLLDDEGKKLGVLGFGFSDARGAYETGDAPAKAAKSLLRSWGYNDEA